MKKIIFTFILIICFILSIISIQLFSQNTNNRVYNKQSATSYKIPATIKEQPANAKSDSAISSILKSYGKKIYFTENKGQWDDNIIFKADFPLGQAQVRKEGMLVGMFDPASVKAAHDWSERREESVKEGNIFNEPKPTIKGHSWLMRFKNSTLNPIIIGSEEYQDHFNYFRGNDRSKHVTNALNYGEIRYENVYENIDVRYYPSEQGTLEYDLICKPGADPGKIELELNGADGIYISNGHLRIKTTVGEMDLPEPYSYQKINGKEVRVKTAFKATGKNSIAFEVKDYDATQALIIDPIALRWSTWISNDASSNAHGHGIWVDQNTGNIYVTGWYDSGGLIVTPGAFQTQSAGGEDLFIGCYIQPTNIGGPGTRVWQTYLGGSGTDNPYAIEEGFDGNIYIVGQTSSADYPLLGGTAFNGGGASIDDRSSGGGFGGSNKIFITKMTTDGQSIKSSVIGGNGSEEAYDLRHSKNGDVLVCGGTSSTNLGTLFPGTGAVNTGGGGYGFGSSVLVFRINNDLSSIVWMRNYGGSGTDLATIMVADTGTGNIFVAGHTTSTNFPTTNPRQSTLGGRTDGFIQELNDSGITLWSSYFNSASSKATSILCMEFNTTHDHLYFGGTTTGLSSDNISSTGVYSSTIAGGTDFFVSNMGIDQTFVGATYLGSSSSEYNMMGLNVDENNDIYILGYTPGTNFPVTSDAFQSTNMGNNDATFTKISSDLSTLLYSTYYGGTSDDSDPIGERGIKFSNCRIYTIVTSESNNIPLTEGAVTTNKISSTRVLEPSLQVWANPPDLRGDTLSGDQTYCYGQIPSTNLTGPVPSYLLPTISRNGTLSSYPSMITTVTYQWQSSKDGINWTNVAGGTSQNLPDSLIGPLNQTTYFRRIINGDACNISGSTIVTIKVAGSAPSVTITPAPSASFCAGDSIILYAHTGTGFTYQWQNASGDIPGQTNSTYTAKTPGAYDVVVVEEGGCSAKSNPTILTLKSPVTVNPILRNQSNCVGDGIAFSIKPTSGTGPFSYKWLHNGQPVTDGGGGTTSIYYNNNVNVNDDGTYSCIISNSCSSQTGEVVILTVVTPLTLNPPFQNKALCGGDSIGFTISPTSGLGPFSYQWLLNGYQVTDGSGGTTSLFYNKDIKGADAGTYSCIVTNACNSQTGKVATITITAPVTINPSFYDKYQCLDSSVAFTLNPTGGAAPFSYQWLHNGTAIPNATTSLYSKAHITEGDVGKYSCIISNACNSVTGDVVSLTVVICNRTHHSISGHVTYDNTSKTPMSSKTANTATEVYLYNTAGDTIIQITQTDNSGSYEFINLVNHIYWISGNSVKPWGGGNPIDALIINRCYIHLASIKDSLWYHAALVSGDKNPSPIDALDINRRYINLTNKFSAVPDWLFQKIQVTMASNDLIQNVEAECYGDVNGSFVPPLLKPRLIYTPVNNIGTLNINCGQQFEIPVYINTNVALGALGLKLKTNDSKLKIIGLSSAINSLIYNVTDDGINIAWSATDNAINVNPDQPVLMLHAIYTGIQNPEALLLSPESVISDIDVNIISNDNFVMPKLILNNLKSSSLQFYNHPNPFNNITNVEYTLPEDLNVKIDVYNVLGEKVATLTNGFQKAGKYTLKFDGTNLKQGVYYSKIEAANNISVYTKTDIMMIAR